MAPQASPRTIVLLTVATISTGLLLWHFSRSKKKQESSAQKKSDGESTGKPGFSTPVTSPAKKAAVLDADPTPRRTNSASRSADDATAATVPTIDDLEKVIHAEIEQLDKKGKEFFKDKKVRQDITRSLDGLSNRSISFCLLLPPLCMTIVNCSL
jgi:hypothetical protein